jgi:hypothetical protein
MRFTNGDKAVQRAFSANRAEVRLRSDEKDARDDLFGKIQMNAALAILSDALNRCRDEDMRTPEVFAALDLLESQASIAWPFEQFRRSLDFGVGDESHAGGRWQNVHASLNAVRRAVNQ